jgi:hypothetical protein
MDNDTTAPEKSRVSRIHVGRVYNLGNYENERVEVTVEIGSQDDPSRVLRSVENILADLHAKSGIMGHNLRQAESVLAKPESELSTYAREEIPTYREWVAKRDAAAARRLAAREALSTLEYTREHIDHKEKWEDEDDRY